MSTSTKAPASVPVSAPETPERRALGRPIPAEGQDGLFTQSWFPICRSDEVKAGEVVGRDFLGGRVVVFRPLDAPVQVLSGYCAHLGADLSRSDVVDDAMVCPLHRWRWDSTGHCVATGTGLLDEPPASARLFPFPTAERYGLVWAFNGREPLWQLPDLRFPDDELVIHVGELGVDLAIDPFVFAANTMDMQHLQALHGVAFDPEFLVDDRYFTYTEFSSFVDMSGNMRGTDLSTVSGVWGTSFFTLEGEIDGEWFAVLDALALPSPQRTQVFIVGFSHAPAGNEQKARRAFQWEYDVLMEDIEVLASLHFRPGPLTRSDTHVAKFFEYLRRYPRAHPSADFIT
ncbi:MAG: Rieske 2Fe-2S domain-containing protein [Dermatophilaceae bacterium]